MSWWNINHHSLFFDVDFNQHAKDIYDEPKWPQEPLFYANFPSLTDSTCAPNGMEAGFFLIPLAIGIEDTPKLRQEYFDKAKETSEGYIEEWMEIAKEYVQEWRKRLDKAFEEIKKNLKK